MKTCFICNEPTQDKHLVIQEFNTFKEEICIRCKEILNQRDDDLDIVRARQITHEQQIQILTGGVSNGTTNSEES